MTERLSDETLRSYRLVHNLDSFARLDWDGLLEQADGPRAGILQTQRSALRIASKYVNSPTSPELLGWFVLWSRAFLILQTSADLRGRLSEPIANYLKRVLFETSLQVRLIKQPFDDWQEQSRDGSRTESADVQWAKVGDRLRGYCAWLLVNDLSLIERNMTDHRLRAGHAASPKDEMWSPETSRLLEPILGAQEIVGEAEGSMDLKNAQQYTRLRKERLRSWLSDRRFSHWVLNELASALEVPNLRKGAPSLGELLHPREKTGFGVTKALLGEHLYVGYAVGSNLLHGSTLEFSVVVTPRNEIVSRDTLLMNQPESPSPAEELAELARVVLFEIAAMGERVVPTD